LKTGTVFSWHWLCW